MNCRRLTDGSMEIFFDVDYTILGLDGSLRPWTREPRRSDSGERSALDWRRTLRRRLVVALSLLGLWAVRQQPTGYAELAHLDVGMLLTTFALAIVASLFAGLLPAWRAMQVTPAIQLKSQ